MTAVLAIRAMQRDTGSSYSGGSGDGPSWVSVVVLCVAVLTLAAFTGFVI